MNNRNKGEIMKYYKTWQAALVDFIELFGHNFEDSYNLTAEFELMLKRNIKGVWYMYIKKEV